jgi:hypothetical protein
MGAAKVKKAKAVKQTAKPSPASDSVSQVNNLAKLAAEGKYHAVAVAAAEIGAEYLAEEILDGKSHDKATFMPQAFIVGKDGKVSIALLGFVGPNAAQDIEKVGETASKVAIAVAIINAGWVSSSATKSPSARPSQQGDRMTASIGRVWVNGEVVAAVAVPVKGVTNKAA